MSRIALGSLAALGAGLIAVLAVGTAPDGRAPQKPVTAGAEFAGPSRAVAPGTGIGDATENGTENATVASILARPLFNRSRRSEGGKAPVAGVLRLTGVVVGPAGREAIFEPVGGGKPLVVFEGERVNGAVVRVIAPGAVLMIDGRGAHLISPAYGPAGAALPGRSGGRFGGSR
ncbi:MAG: hypothetical protein ACREFU_15950 [Acetobacteraceae bacterium]